MFVLEGDDEYKRECHAARVKYDCIERAAHRVLRPSQAIYTRKMLAAYEEYERAMHAARMKYSKKEL